MNSNLTLDYGLLPKLFCINTRKVVVPVVPVVPKTDNTLLINDLMCFLWYNLPPILVQLDADSGTTQIPLFQLTFFSGHFSLVVPEMLSVVPKMPFVVPELYQKTKIIYLQNI